MKWRVSVALLIIFVVTPALSRASNPSELEVQIERVRREREALVEEQKKLQAELDIINKESRNLGAAVKSLDATRNKLATDINITQSKITSTDLTIRSLESSMTEKEKQIVIHRKAISDTIFALSEYDSRPLIFNLLAATGLSDIWRDGSQLAGLSGRLEEEIEALRETKKILEEEKEEKERVKEEQLSLKGQLSGQKSVVEQNQKAKQQLLIETKNKEAEYQKLLAENIANQKQFEEDLFRLESELRITLDPSLIPEPKHGILFWPLDSVFITQQFGKTSASARLYASGTHNGVDFRASMGTPVKSVLSGTVVGAGNTDEMNAQLRREGKPICGSYGRWILIKHNNGLSSVYAHLSASIVKTGQPVKTGEVIGYSGGSPGVNGSGYSTGPHLHLGLFASQGVQVRQFSTSINCKHVSVPIADPKAHLDPLDYLPAV